MNMAAASCRPWRDNVTCDGLQNEALSFKMVPPAMFDMSNHYTRPELDFWLENKRPSRMRRSDNVGWIMVKSKYSTIEETKIMKGFELENVRAEALEAWQELANDVQNTIRYDDIKVIAERFGLLDGKWLIFPNPGNEQEVDVIWKKLVSGLDDEVIPPSNVIGLKVSPKNDVTVPRVDDKSLHKQSHVIMIYNRHAFDRDEVLKIERIIREILDNTKMRLCYKPSIFTHLKIYRDNAFGLESSSYKTYIDEVTGDHIIAELNLEWSYRPRPPPSPDEGFDDDNDNHGDAAVEVEDNLINAFQQELQAEDRYQNLN